MCQSPPDRRRTLRKGLKSSKKSALVAQLRGATNVTTTIAAGVGPCAAGSRVVGAGGGNVTVVDLFQTALHQLLIAVLIDTIRRGPVGKVAPAAAPVHKGEDTTAQLPLLDEGCGVGGLWDRQGREERGRLELWHAWKAGHVVLHSGPRGLDPWSSGNCCRRHPQGSWGHRGGCRLRCTDGASCWQRGRGARPRTGGRVSRSWQGRHAGSANRQSPPGLRDSLRRHDDSRRATQQDAAADCQP
mmetsp:Transcript_58580/g.174346  ORF Transcript_58580/g.174346 Transcript_58580/m.174346 type:complete len:243 (+) Transcript_58580:312-1040(+)